tara:strand:+ start:38 stop:799 length:762 start_codon:yes stop_codon:yes gene_type:complete
MKFVFLVVVILINCINHPLIKSEEKIDKKNNKIEKIAKKEESNKNEPEKRKIHIVKSGDTLSSISKLYSINKDLIIKLNKLKNENYIYVGQNLTIFESNKKSSKPSDFKNYHHIVQIGENLTEISNIHNLNLGYLIEINNLKNPDSIQVGQKLIISRNEPISSETYQIINNKKNNKLSELDKKIYGPIIIQNKSFKKIEGEKVLNVRTQKNKKLILSINCDTKELNVRIPGRKWRGKEPVKEEFEKNLINDFC